MKEFKGSAQGATNCFHQLLKHQPLQN